MHRIEAAGPESIETIRTLANATWRISYREMISGEQIDYMLEMMYSPSSLLKQMESGHRFFLAYDDTAPCGFASVSPAENKKDKFRLHKLYVLPGYQGKGLGKELLGKVIEFAAASGATALELNVNRNNPSVAFYKNQGFSIAETVDLDIGGGFFMNDYIMERNI